MYSVCARCRCLGTYDFDKGSMSDWCWSAGNQRSNNWLFHVRKGLKFHNGTPVTATTSSTPWANAQGPAEQADAKHCGVASEKALNDYTVQSRRKFHGALLDYLFDRIIVTSKDLYDKYAEVADKQYRSALAVQIS